MDNNIKKKKDGKTSSSILVGVLVCFVLIAVYGIVSQLKVSYAFPEVLEKIDAEEVEFIKTATSDLTKTKSDANFPRELTDKFKGEATVNGVTYQIDMFCLQALKEIPDAGLDYKKYPEGANLIDEGINAIVIDAYKNVTTQQEGGKTVITLTEEEYYNAQMAIWIFQNNIYKDDYVRPTGLNDHDSTVIASLEQEWTYIKAHKTEGESKKIYDYIQKAIAAKTSTTTNSISVVGDDTKIEFKLTTDEKYFETPLMQVQITKNVNTEFSGFKFTVGTDNKNVPVKVIGEDGSEVTDLSQLESGKKFKLQINKSDLPTDTNVNVSGNLEGKFNHMGFVTYKQYDKTTNKFGDDFQVALLAANTSKTEYAKISLNVSIPDTGAGYTGYIYIIGALVLIVGLTIIYVNTKVQEN